MNYREQKKVRIPYPRISFARVCDYLFKIRDTYPDDNALTKEQITRALGFSPTSGTAHTALGALSHYNLADKVGLQKDLRYHLTDLALKLVESRGNTNWATLALKSAIHPEAFNFLYSYYEQGALPSNIKNQLVERYKEVSPKNVDDILRLFYDSMDFINKELPAESSASPLVHKEYEFSLWNGMVVSVTQEVIIKALQQYFKDSN